VWETFEKVIRLTEVRRIESDSANADRYLALLDHSAWMGASAEEAVAQSGRRAAQGIGGHHDRSIVGASGGSGGSGSDSTGYNKLTVDYRIESNSRNRPSSDWMISLRARWSSPPRIFGRPLRAFPTRVDCLHFLRCSGKCENPRHWFTKGALNTPVLVWWLFCSDKLPGETPVDTCATGSSNRGPRSPMLSRKRTIRSNCHLERQTKARQG
jgi:hypothetical protein